MKAAAILLIGATSAIQLNQLGPIDVNVKVNVNGEEVANTAKPPVAVVPTEEIKRAVKDAADVEKKGIQEESSKVRKQ